MAIILIFFKKYRERVEKIAIIAAKFISPIPTKVPTAAVIHTVAAVVSPRTCSPLLIMIPAPRKPTPTTILAITPRNPLFLAITSGRLSGEIATRYGKVRAIMAKIAAPAETNIEVLTPASRPLISRSRPITAPRRSATRNRINICENVSIDIILYQYANGHKYKIMRTTILEIKNNEGKEVEFTGWVHARRDHGKLVFIDLRDRSGLVQVVFPPNVPGASDVRLEYCIKISALVKRRPEKMINADQPNGEFELEAKTLEVLNKAEAMPISVDTDGMEIDEEVRMKYRYLDLRRARLKDNMLIRGKVTKYIRDFLIDKEDFVEVETPILTKSTPEGARDYLVPSRIYPGKFYALPQSPQQYKQLLMVAGLEKYFQIARCFRDEDTRGDRQPEFTQLDIEMSFVEREDVMALNEALLIEIVEKLFPEKKIQEKPFPRITYKEAMEKYGIDRPDLRADKNDPNLLAFCWVIDFPFFEKTKEGDYTFTHNPFSAPKPEFMDDLLAQKNIDGILTTQYDVVLNGFEIGGGSIRNHQPEALRAVFKVMGFEDERIDANFGHMLEALSFGAPPHGGIAWGMDRLVTLLRNEPNIREVIAFPKTGDGRDLMMNAPSAVEEKQLEELKLETKKNKDVRK